MDIITDSMLKQTDENVNEIYNDLVLNIDNNKLPEDIFVNYFLPFFCKEITINDNPEIIREWLMVAGTITSKVDIIEGNGKTNKVIFTVPSFISTKAIKSINMDSVNMKAIISDYIINKDNQLSNPVGSLLDNLDKKFQADVVPDKISEEDVETWNEIFKRYGKVNTTSIKDKGLVKDDPYNMFNDEYSYD